MAKLLPVGGRIVKVGWIALGLVLSGCGVLEHQQDQQRAKEALQAQLRDPKSAQFRSLRISTVITPEGSLIKSVCGEINGKNSFGGYVGFRPFVYVVERKLSPKEVARGQGWHPWEKSHAYIAGEEEVGTKGDMARICRDQAILSEDDVNLITPNLSNLY